MVDSDYIILWEIDKVQTTPYSQTVYYDPKFGNWEEWFAWRPVKMIHWVHHDDGFGKGMKWYEWVWLKKILRRKVDDFVDVPGGGGGFARTQYEYTTLMNILKDGY